MKKVLQRKVNLEIFLLSKNKSLYLLNITIEYFRMSLYHFEANFSYLFWDQKNFTVHIS